MENTTIADAIKQIMMAAAITQANEAIETATKSYGDKTGVVALPSDFEPHDLEQFMSNRRRARGVMRTTVVKDFVEYTQAQAAGHQASIFLDPDSMSATAVLNMGTPGLPGHADNTAVLSLFPTAAYAALLQKATGIALAQKDVVEFFEDWGDNMEFFTGSSNRILPKVAANTMRKITVETLQRMQNEEEELSQSRSLLENTKASSSVGDIPTTIHFTATPFEELSERVFILRLSVVTGKDGKPGIVLRITKQQVHAEEMARELSADLADAVNGSVPIYLGRYSRAG